MAKKRNRTFSPAPLKTKPFLRKGTQAADLISLATMKLAKKAPGVTNSVNTFVEALREHRHWKREKLVEAFPY